MDTPSPHFITALPPFDRLEAAAQARVVAALDLEYFPTGQVLLRAGDAPEFLYILFKGVVEELGPDGERGLHAPRDGFSGLALLSGRCGAEFKVREEALCYLLPKTVFLELARSYPQFENFYYQNLGQRLERLSELRNQRELASFMLARIRDAYLHPPLWVDADTSIFEAVQTLQQHKLSAVLVRGEGGRAGIVTDTDIRRHVVLERKSVDAPVGEVASWELLSLQHEDFLFNALLTMTRHSVKRLVIYQDGTVCGVLDQMDLLSYFSHHSHLISVQIERATDLAQLEKASRDIRNVVQSLHANGTKIESVSRLVSELNRKVFAKLFELTAPPAWQGHACVVVLGSEGRGEQILKTDQDNALILRDGLDYPGLEAFATRFSAALQRCGYPPCPGRVMLDNPAWRGTQEAFRQRLYRWLDEPSAEHVMHLAIFYDAAAVAGDPELLAGLKTYVYRHLGDNAGYLSHFARPVLSFETPLSWLAQFIVDKHQHDGLDIKKGGIFPLVHGVRALALQYRLSATHTQERLRQLRENGVLSAELAEELGEALAFMLGLRLDTELEQLRQGEVYNNYLYPAKLNKLERDLLRDCLKIVNRFKQFVSHHYHLERVT